MDKFVVLDYTKNKLIPKFKIMNKNFYLAFVLMVFSISMNAQETIMEKGVSDEMTVDAEQNEKWRMGELKYSAKPKNAWELGVHFGHFFIDGDVDRKIPGGYGVGLHLRKAVHYAFSVRADFFYGQAKGLDPQPSGSNLLPEQSVFAGYGPSNPWFFSHKTRYIYGALQGVINIGNILFHKEKNVWNIYATVGAGFDTHKTMLDLRDSNGQVYTDLINRTGFNQANDFDTKAGRSAIKDALETIYDGDYETEGFKKKGIFRLGDDTNFHVVWTTSVGVSRKISRRFNIGIEHQLMLSDNDYLDGQKWRTDLDQTNNVDIGHYTNIRLAFNLGNLSKKTEPLYWLNPLDATFNDIAELKQRPILDLTDEDGDGVIDMLDQELNSAADCPVDTRGVTLDSDGDGLPDCKDEEPYSPPGFNVNEKGIADLPDIDVMTEEEVIAILNKNCPGCKRVDTGCGEWFLPMIHFDLDKYSIKPEFYGHLHHVATVLRKCPDICVTVNGHTDSRNTDEYNTALSYKRAKESIDYLVNNYGISRDRLKLMYGGESTPLPGVANGGSAEKKHYMNRRVEFNVCESGDYDMPEPAGVQKLNGGSSNGGSKYGGNKSSGY